MVNNAATQSLTVEPIIQDNLTIANYADLIKAFKGNIDYLISGISQVELPFKQQLKQARTVKLADKRERLQQQMNLICGRRGIEPIHVPMADVRKRMSKANRLALLIQLADNRAKSAELRNAAVVHGVAVDANGEIIGKAKTMTVVGSDEKIQALKAWAKKNGVVIKG